MGLAQCRAKPAGNDAVKWRNLLEKLKLRLSFGYPRLWPEHLSGHHT